jgi:membrane protease YdiL (CAAX protease family)
MTVTANHSNDLVLKKSLPTWVLIICLAILLITPYTLNLWWKFLPSLFLMVLLLQSQFSDYRVRLGLISTRRLVICSFFMFSVTWAAAVIIVPKCMRLHGIELYQSSDWHLGWAIMPITQSLGEELVLRALLLNALLPMIKSRTTVVVTSAVIFAVWHMVFFPFAQNVWLSLPTVATLFMFGLATNVIFVITRSIALPLAFHAGWNLVQFGGEYRSAVTFQSVSEGEVFNAVQGSGLVFSLAAGLVLFSVLWLQKKRLSQ